jgi:hypothetical protein
MIVFLLLKDLIGLHDEVRDLLLSMQPLLDGQLLLLVPTLRLLRCFRSLHFFFFQLDAILGLVLPRHSLLSMYKQSYMIYRVVANQSDEIQLVLQLLAKLFVLKHFRVELGTSARVLKDAGHFDGSCPVDVVETLAENEFL